MTSDMKLHAKKRRMLNLAFTDQSVKASGQFMARHIDRWNELLVSTQDSNGRDEWSESHDISTWANYLVFDILGDLCFGADSTRKNLLRTE
jgi:cytochrome P450